MNKEKIIEAGKYVAFLVVMYVCIWGAAKLFADSVSDYEIINPTKGIECVVVSRMFNTSVDCWEKL